MRGSIMLYAAENHFVKEINGVTLHKIKPYQ